MDGLGGDGRDELEVHGPGGTSFRARGYDILNILIVILISVMTFEFWMHLQDAKIASDALRATNDKVAETLAKTNKDIVETMKESNKAQRLTACIISQPEVKREQQYMQSQSFCNRMSQ